MDIKMGTRGYGDDATPEQISKHCKVMTALWPFHAVGACRLLLVVAQTVGGSCCAGCWQKDSASTSATLGVRLTGCRIESADVPGAGIVAAPIPALHTAPRIMASAGEYELVGHKYKIGEPRCAEQLRQILERFLSTPFVGSSRNGSTLSRFPFRLPMACAHGPPLTSSPYVRIRALMSSRQCGKALRDAVD